jgi:hypothetical protein
MDAETQQGLTDTPPPCPTCGSTDIGPVLYGFPGPEMWSASREGRIRLGGCVIGPQADWSDDWFCRSCTTDR